MALRGSGILHEIEDGLVRKISWPRGWRIEPGDVPPLLTATVFKAGYVEIVKEESPVERDLEVEKAAGHEQGKRVESEDGMAVSGSLTDGEIDFFSFASILHLSIALLPKGDMREMAPNHATRRFLDLGSGRGKAVIATALLHGDVFSELIGIEIRSELHSEALEAKEAYKRHKHREQSQP